MRNASLPMPLSLLHALSLRTHSIIQSAHSCGTVLTWAQSMRGVRNTDA